MATIEYWIQIENNPWDVAPNNIDRITGQSMQQITGKAPVPKTLVSPVTGVVRNRAMFRPLSEDALILRRYTPDWAAPDDHKVNPWDLNEPDPTDNGTMGTIPGAVIECNVGDQVIVHLRNKDFRANKDVKARAHSLHPHGFVFAPTSDGAYPLAPPDPAQPVGGESALWASLGVTGFKKADRVPPGGTYTYTWNTFGWPTTAGVWLYHDHSICDMENVQQGAIGIIVIHNNDATKHSPIDPDEPVITPADLPGGSPTGSPVQIRCFPFPFDVHVLPHDLEGLAALEQPHHALEAHHKEEKPAAELMVRRGDVLLELARDFHLIRQICLPFYRTPPEKALYLQLFHNLGDAMMCINGRKYLGNTPTLIAGRQTKMRFGVVGMGNVDGFHTFHLHGHRWVIPGPDGNNPGAIQGSPQIKAVSQFEDTRTFGPANSFGFTINQGSFMGSLFTPDPTRAPALGEWHMHCHVLTHMMDGMMGSLLNIQGGELAFGLPRGEPCPTGAGVGCPPGAILVTIGDFFFAPQNVMINAGQTVCWTNTGGAPHTVTSNPGPSGCNPASAEAFDSGNMIPGAVFQHTFNTPGTFAYHCEVHGCGMSGTVTVM